MQECSGSCWTNTWLLLLISYCIFLLHYCRYNWYFDGTPSELSFVSWHEMRCTTSNKHKLLQSDNNKLSSIQAVSVYGCISGVIRSPEVMQSRFQSWSDMNVASHGQSVVLLFSKLKRYRSYTEKIFTHQSFLTGDVGEEQRTGHQQKKEEHRQLHGVVLVRLSAPAGSCYYQLLRWRGLQYAHRDDKDAEVPISSAQYHAENKPSAAASQTAGMGCEVCVWPVSVYCDSGRGGAGSGGQHSGSPEEEGGGGKHGRVGLRRGV